MRHFSARPVLILCASGIAASVSYGAQPPDVVVSDAQANTAMGSRALDSLTTGISNTAAGSDALAANTTGSENTAVGATALQLESTGTGNTAVGAGALFANQASGNTATGFGALNSNSSGGDNTAMGLSAMLLNNSGGSNVAFGAYALFYNSTGTANTASGANALIANTTGNYNTADGFYAMSSNKSGAENTAIGHNALGTNQGGSNNIAIGSNAGYDVRGGRYNIEIGNVGGANDAGTIRLGASSQQSTAYIAGIVNSHVAGSAVYVTATGQLGVLASSERYKTDVASMGSSSEKVKELRPVTFHLKTDPKAGVQYGLIAEEVAKVYPELVIRGDKGQIEGVRYEELTPMLLNEVQRQQAELGDMRHKLVELEKLVNTLSAQAR